MPAFLIFPKYVLHCCKAEDRRNFHRKVIKGLNKSWKIDANTKVSNNLMQWRENANILRNDAIAYKYQYWEADAIVCECTNSIFSLSAPIHIDAHWRLPVACCCTHFLLSLLFSK